MFCFYSTGWCRSDGSIGAGAKLDGQAGSSELTLQHSGGGSVRGTKRTRLRSSIAHLNIKIHFFSCQTSTVDGCTTLVPDTSVTVQHFQGKERCS